MATGVYLGDVAGVAPSATTSSFSINAGDYVFAAVSGHNPGSLTITGTPSLNFLTSITGNPPSETQGTVLFGALATSTGSYQYTVNTSSGSLDGGFDALFFKVAPGVDETLSRTNPIGSYAVGLGTMGTVNTSVDPQKGDVVFGICGYYGSTNTFTDTDTSNGSWSQLYSRNSYAGIFGQFKNVTGTGQQSYGGTWSTEEMDLFIVTISATQTNAGYWGIRV